MTDSVKLKGSVGAGGSNGTVDTFTVQFLLNVARARTGMKPIGLDGEVGPETIGVRHGGWLRPGR